MRNINMTVKQLLNKVMSGQVIEVHFEPLKDELVKELENEQHNGIFIAGNNPWNIGVVTSGVNK